MNKDILIDMDLGELIPQQTQIALKKSRIGKKIKTSSLKLLKNPEQAIILRKIAQNKINSQMDYYIDKNGFRIYEIKNIDSFKL